MTDLFTTALASFRATHGTCASCHAHDHTVWSCPDEAAMDAEVFARAFAVVNPREGDVA